MTNPKKKPIKTKLSTKLSKDQQKQWSLLVDSGRRRRESKGNGKHGRVDKNGGIELNWDDDTHVRACAYLLLMSARRMRVREAVAHTGMDWITFTMLKDHCQEFHDAYCAMLQAQKARMRDNAAGLVDEVMDGAEVSNAQGRMAAWALERLDEDYRPAPVAQVAQSGAGAIGGGIVINLVANACDNGVTMPQAIDITPANTGDVTWLSTPKPSEPCEPVAEIPQATVQINAQQSEDSLMKMREDVAGQ